MSRITLQGAILIGVIAICISGIAIALITHDDCFSAARPQIGAFDRPPPPHGMQGGFGRDRGFGRQELGGREMGPPRQNERQGGRRGRRPTE